MPQFFGYDYVLPVSIASVVRAYGQDSLSLKTHITQEPAQRWEFGLNLNPTRDAGPILAILTDKAYIGTFDFEPPQPRGSRTDDGVTAGAVAAGAKTLSLADAAGVLPGQFFTVGTARKGYLVVSVTGSDVRFAPAALAPFADTATVDFTPALPCRFPLDQELGVVYQRNGLATVSLRIVEAL